MKKWTQIMLIVLESLVIVGCAVVLMQKENIQAVYEGLTTAEADIKQQITDTKKEVDLALERYELKDIRQLTLEEEEQIKRGELSVEDAVKRIMPMIEAEGVEGASAEEALESDREQVQKASETEKKEKDIVKRYTAQMYTLQSKYVGLLGGLEARGIQALQAIPSEERTIQRMMDVGMPFVQEGLSLESQCDGEVAAVLETLKAELVAIEADYAIVETMKQAYDAEKRLKKAYYFSLIP